jgi:hypothetical protein
MKKILIIAAVILVIYLVFFRKKAVTTPAVIVEAPEKKDVSRYDEAPKKTKPYHRPTPALVLQNQISNGSNEGQA